MYNTSLNFRIQNCKNLNFQPNTHAEYEIIYVVEGCLLVCVNGNDIPIYPGQAIFLPPYFVHAFKTEESSECYIWEFDSTLIPEHLPDDIILFPLQKTPDNIVFNVQNQDNIFVHKAVIYQLLSLIDKEDSKKYTPQSADLCLEAIKFIAENFQQPITLQDAAKHLCVNYSYLSRVFKEFQCLSFTECLNGTRLNHATTLLCETNMSVTDIALCSGFGSVRNFNRLFSKKMHCSPYELRKNAHNK